MSKKAVVIVLLYLWGAETFGQRLQFLPHKTNTGVISYAFLAQLKKLFKPDIFIETGTLRGDSTLVAATIFNTVATIELSPYFFKRACARFTQAKNITAYCGPSEEILPKILKSTAKQKPLIFLDAHYSGGATALGSANTPILEEIKIIGELCPRAVILVDDLRLFQSHIKCSEYIQNNPNDANIAGYPTLNEVNDFLKKIHPAYTLNVVGDAFIVYRKDLYRNIQLSPIIEALTISRLCPITETNAQKIAITISAEKIFIKNAQKLTSDAQYLLKNGLNSPDIFASYYHLWHGLIALGKNNKKLAKYFFNLALQNGMHYERVRYYMEKL